MNRCEEVLKHSINKGLKIEKDELYHSDTYLGSEYDEGLKHWKYIKKYKNSKGKTVYVYANKETHNRISDINALAKSSKSDAEYEARITRDFVRYQPTWKDAIDRHAKLSELYDNLATGYTEKYDTKLSNNKPGKVIKRDVHNTVKAVKNKVKKGFDFIEGYFKYLAGR